MRPDLAPAQAAARRRARASALLTSFVVAGLGLAACTRPTPPVGLADCYENLPLATAALNAPKDSYHFSGVKLVPPQMMARLVGHRFPTDPGAHFQPPAANLQVCAFAFTGDFPSGQVAGAPNGVSGKAAIVLVTTQRKLLFSFVLPRLPIRFSSMT